MTSEENIQLLEMYLDGALEPSEVSTVEHRLAAEAELAAELKRLQVDRAVRQRLWESFEPATNSADRIVAAITKKQTQRAWYMRLLDQRQRIAAAAACIAVFMIGWQWGRNANTSLMVPGPISHNQPVSLITQQQVPNGKASIFEVRLTDGSGKLVRVERFSSFEDAQRFIEKVQSDLRRGSN